MARFPVEREAVRPMVGRDTTQRPERVLQPFGQGDIALAAQHHRRVLEPGIGQSKVIQPVIQRLTGHGEPRSPPMSVKSDRPIRPGSWVWRKITSRSGPCSARQARMRRSSVRRMPGLTSGCRRRSSSKIATGREAGEDFNSGTISASKIFASGSGHRLLRGTFFCVGRTGSEFMR